MSKTYAGIGSRKTPPEICTLMRAAALKLDELGYILRSGGAKGADQAFAAGSAHSEIFLAKDAKPWAYNEVLKYVPTDRSNFNNWTPYIKGLLARNMMQVLGEHGDDPVNFVLCWAPSLVYTDSSSGGTGWAIRCALAHNIEVFNMFDQAVAERIKGWLSL